MKCANTYFDVGGEVRDLLLALIDEVMGERFLARTQKVFPLRVSEYDTEARPNIALMLFPEQITGVLVVEDKPPVGPNEAVTVQDDEAQVIAEGIAAAQADSWPAESPFYMLRCKGAMITVYRAVFSENLLESVRHGSYPAEVTRFQKFSSPTWSQNGGPGLNIMEPTQRQQLVQVLCDIQADIETRFPTN
ncbi:hypothetical protein BGX26_004578 [Mortierella sp. AD094]|nr:hypothetical protein BGX26_004578 [Mortierella sp. AD094]